MVVYQLIVGYLLLCYDDLFDSHIGIIRCIKLLLLFDKNVLIGIKLFYFNLYVVFSYLLQRPEPECLNLCITNMNTIILSMHLHRVV